MLGMMILERWANLFIYKLPAGSYYPPSRSMLLLCPCCVHSPLYLAPIPGLATSICVSRPHSNPVGNQGSFRSLRGCGLGTLIRWLLLIGLNKTWLRAAKRKHGGPHETRQNDGAFYKPCQRWWCWATMRCSGRSKHVLRTSSRVPFIRRQSRASIVEIDER
jgi:hypothetical protein